MVIALGTITYPYDKDDVEGFARFYGCPESTVENPIDYEAWAKDYVVRQLTQVLKAYNASKIDAQKQNEALAAISVLESNIYNAITIQTEEV